MFEFYNFKTANLIIILSVCCLFSVFLIQKPRFPKKIFLIFFLFFIDPEKEKNK